MLKRFFEASNRFIEKSKYSGLVIALVSFLAVLGFSFTEAYEIFELNLYDLRFKMKPSVDEWDRLVFLDIDENSMTTIGEFPWPRDKYAEAFDVLSEIGAYQVSLDIMFPDSSPIQINRDNYKDLVVKAKKKRKVSETDVMNVAVDRDSIFAGGVRRSENVILSYTFTPDPLTMDVLERQKSPVFVEAKKRFTRIASIPVPKGKEKDYESIKEIGTISYPIPELMKTAHSFGFVNRYTDIDGVIRKVRLVRMYQGRLYFNLAMAMLIDLFKVKPENILVTPGKEILLKKALHPDNYTVKDISVPIDKSGMMFVNWAGPGPREKSFRLVSFYSLLDYGKWVEAVHTYFDEVDRVNQSEKRILLHRQYDTIHMEFINSTKLSDKQELWKKLAGIKKEILLIQKNYQKQKEKDIDDVKKELRKKDDPGLKEELEFLKAEFKAIKLVNMVESLSGKAVLTGLTAVGTHDIGVIPLSKEYARVGTYHNTVNTIYNEEYIRQASPALNILFMLIVALTMGFVIQRLNARMSILTIIAFFIVLNGFVSLVFALTNIWIEQLGVSLSMLIPSVTIAAIKFLNEENQKRFIKNAFSHYLAPGVIDEIIKNPESLELGGEDREITIFFSDVAGFSTISEKLTPPELVKRLNEYLSEMTDIILSYGGTVDKYEGDAIMAFYGAPHHMDDHAVKACLASIDMKRRLRELQEEWTARGEEPLSARMGMNTGIAVVGNMGSSTRMDYTAMGDSVNLASRLEGVNKHYSTHAMISESTYSKAKDYLEVRKLDRIRVVGKSEPVTIYELLGKKESLPDRMYEMLEIYDQGLEYFTNREWKKARSVFKKALKVIPDDGPSMTYVDRCGEFMKKPPSKSWDGVYKMKSK
jgi:adenylate cyclase